MQAQDAPETPGHLLLLSTLMPEELRLPAVPDWADSTQLRVAIEPSQYLVTAGACAGRGGLSLWPSGANEAELTFLHFSPFFPVSGTLWQPSCLRTRTGHSQRSREPAGLGTALA